MLDDSGGRARHLATTGPIASLRWDPGRPLQENQLLWWPCQGWQKETHAWGLSRVRFLFLLQPRRAEGFEKGPADIC